MRGAQEIDERRRAYCTLERSERNEAGGPFSTARLGLRLAAAQSYSERELSYAR